jgi:hypothetical protein
MGSWLEAEITFQRPKNTARGTLCMARCASSWSVKRAAKGGFRTLNDGFRKPEKKIYTICFWNLGISCITFALGYVGQWLGGHQTHGIFFTLNTSLADSHGKEAIAPDNAGN